MSPKARERVIACLAKHPGIVAAYLFGSTARGGGSPLSDVDVAILWARLPEKALRERARLIEDLSRAAKATADVIFLNDAPPALAGRVLRDGKLLLSRDDTERIRYEIRALQRDLDAVHLRRSFDRTLTQSIREGRFYG